MFGHACVTLFARHSGSTEALAGENVTSHVEGSSAVAATRIATIATVNIEVSILTTLTITPLDKWFATTFSGETVAKW